MRQYGAFEAKTHFSELLSAVTRGEKIIITKNRVKVAMISPFSEEKNENEGEDLTVEAAIRAIKKLRKGVTLGKKLSIREMREEGRC